MDDMRLRLGRTADQALQGLHELTQRVENIAHGTVGLTSTDQRDEYLRWAEQAEAHLRGFFVAPNAWQDLHTARYWHLHEATKDTPMLFSLVRAEAEWQSERLKGLAERLRHAQQIFELPVGWVVVVPDSNVFAHYRRFDEIPWPHLTGAASVRLVVPSIVLDELDELSYKSRAGGERARDVVRAIAKLRGNHPPEAPVEVRRDTTLQILIDPPGHIRRLNHDDEVLTRAEYLASVVGDRVIVATGDYGMQVRARARGLRSTSLPMELRLDPPKSRDPDGMG